MQELKTLKEIVIDVCTAKMYNDELTDEKSFIKEVAEAIPVIFLPENAKPQEGDIVLVDRFYYERKRNPEEYANYKGILTPCRVITQMNSRSEEFLEFVYPGCGMGDNRKGSFEIPYKIILRNNLPVVTVKSEL